jgi:hypothetical protein
MPLILMEAEVSLHVSLTGTPYVAFVGACLVNVKVKVMFWSSVAPSGACTYFTIEAAVGA